MNMEMKQGKYARAAPEGNYQAKGGGVSTFHAADPPRCYPAEPERND